MNGKMIWDDLRVFLAVVRAQTLSGAAQGLNLGIATVSRRIERLENAVGQPLFLRQQTGYQLTDDGMALVERAEEMEATAQSLLSAARQDAKVSGVVRLATAENFATHLLLPAIGTLREAHPDLTLEILTDIATVNLHKRDADIALRMVKPERGNVSLQRLGVLGYGLYGSQEYVSSRTASADSANYEDDTFIGWAETHGHLPAARWLERLLRGQRPGLITSSLATQFVACAAGQGLAVLPHFIASPQLLCVEDRLGINQNIWLVTQSDLAQSRRVKVVADFCRQLVAQHHDALRGPAVSDC